MSKGRLTPKQEAPPKRAAPPRPRGARAPTGRPVSGTDSEVSGEVHFSDETLRRWFEEEVETLQRLAHTQRLKGDYVAAQFLEHEIRQLALETAALLQAEGR